MTVRDVVNRPTIKIIPYHLSQEFRAAALCRRFEKSIGKGKKYHQNPTFLREKKKMSSKEQFFKSCQAKFNSRKIHPL